MPYLLGVPTNDLTAFDHAPTLRRCDACGLPLNRLAAGIEVFARPRGCLQLSRTLDGFVLAGRIFQRRALIEGWIGLEWHLLVNGYSIVRPERAIRIVHHTEQLDHLQEIWPPTAALMRTPPCASCDQSQRVEFDGDIAIALGEIPVGTREVVRANIETGRGDMRQDIWIVGDGIAALLLRKQIARISIGRAAMFQSWPAASAIDESHGKAEIIRFPRPKQLRPRIHPIIRPGDPGSRDGPTE